jgi:hypothetical protein
MVLKRKMITGVLAAMLLASFLLAVVSFVSVREARAAPPEPLSCHM